MTFLYIREHTVKSAFDFLLIIYATKKIIFLSSSHFFEIRMRIKNSLNK